MRILITNDDGVHAEGIKALHRELSRFHEVLLVAPDREQSATGHSLTLTRPLRLDEYAPGCYACDGTPTDSVLLAVLKILRHKLPDMLISGINHGPNMGEDILYSGTVAAAIEGSQMGIPSMAVSMCDSIGADFKEAARFVRRFIKLYPRLKIKPSTIFNINFPGRVKGGFSIYQYTSLGTRRYDDIIVEKTDPRGQDYYWIAGSPQWEMVPGSDIQAVESGAVSVTPIHLHFTDGETLRHLLSGQFKFPR